MWTRIMMRTVRDLLENLFGRSSTAERGAFFLLNVFISLCCSWWYSSWRLKLSRSLCLHSYGFISNSNIFYKSDIISWRAEVLKFQWQVNCWRADRRHQRHVSRLRHPFSFPDYLSARFARRFFFFFQPRRYFFLFPPMRILVPGYKLYISKYKLMYAYRLYLCTWGYQYSMFPLHKSLQPRLQVWTQRYKSIELSFRACSYYRF